MNKTTIGRTALLMLSFGLFGAKCDKDKATEALKNAQPVCAHSAEDVTSSSHDLCMGDDFCSGIGFCDPSSPHRDARNCVVSDPCVTLGLQRALDDSDTVRRDCSEPADETRGAPFRACRVRDCEEEACWDRDEGLVLDGEVLVAGGEVSGHVVDHSDGFRYSIDCLRAVCTHEICRSRCQDDGLFCNGTEFCDVGVGCWHEGDPCEDQARPGPDGAFECNEVEKRCDWICEDEDGDGVSSVGCGGNDCDDNDPDRSPYNVEVCDVAGKDEDCDGDTVGNRDRDGDGFISDDCFNLIDGEETARGTDCHDGEPGIHPAQNEVCNGVDDNCDGDTDDVGTFEVFVDEDGDGFGVPESGTTHCRLEPGFSAVAGDCDDENPHMFPGAISCADPGNVQNPTYELCQADGTFGVGSCPGSCVQQPSDVGICL